MVGVHRYFKEWRKNPQWSLSWCLALILPLNDLRGEVSGLATTDVLKSQLKTGDMEMTNILIAADEDNGVIDVNPEEKEYRDDHDYDHATESQDLDCQGVSFNKKCTQGTQTELLRSYHVAESV